MKNISKTPAGSGLSWLTLVASTGTLLCCALPMLLVSLGLGAAVAVITSSFPILITLSQNKTWIFIISGSLLVGTAWLMWRNKGQCPVAPGIGVFCQRAQVWNRRIWSFAAAIWTLGFIAAYLALPIQQWLEL